MSRKLHYKLSQNGNNYFINGLSVDSSTFDEIFYDTQKYKQIDYYCYINSNQNFIKEWTLQEN